MTLKNIRLMADPAEGGGAPTTVTAPAGWVSPETLTAKVEEARTQEKNKLYPTIEEQKATILRITGEKAEVEAKLVTANGQLAALGTARTPEGINIEKLIQETTTHAIAQATAATQPVIEDLKARLLNYESENKSLALDRYKARAIATAGGEAAMVVEMVVGNTNEEIDASVARAVATHKRIIEQAGGTATTLNGHANQPATTLPIPGRTAVPTARGPEGTVSALPDVKSMSTSDYAKSREALKRATVGRY